MPLFGGFSRDKTFKPTKGHGTGTKAQKLHQYAQATLGSGDMRSAVSLPPGEDENEWLAVHCVDFYNEASLLFGTVVDYCTPETCPTMSAGPKYEFLWGEGVAKPIRVPAREYVDLLMTWIEGQINNEALFPTSTDTAFPKGFKSAVKNIMKRLFRVYAHVYIEHFPTILSLGAEAHLNTCFKHFIFFVLAFDLIDKKELAPLQELINRMTGVTPPDAAAGASSSAAAAGSASASSGGAGGK